jgi:hypothetical protein
MSDYDFNAGFAAGASAARNKVASYLRQHGIPVPCRWYPPSDEDFLEGIRIALYSRCRRVTATKSSAASDTTS